MQIKKIPFILSPYAFRFVSIFLCDCADEQGDFKAAVVEDFLSGFLAERQGREPFGPGREDGQFPSLEVSGKVIAQGCEQFLGLGCGSHAQAVRRVDDDQAWPGKSGRGFQAEDVLIAYTHDVVQVLPLQGFS